MSDFHQLQNFNFKVALILPFTFLGIFYCVSLRNHSVIEIDRTFPPLKQRISPHSSATVNLSVHNFTSNKAEKKFPPEETTGISKVSTF